MKEELIRIYEEKGPQACADQYGLSYNTARSYYHRWKNAVLEETPKFVPPRVDNIHEGASRLSNIVGFQLQRTQLYHAVETTLSEQQFYQTIRQALYFATNTFLYVYVNRDGPPNVPNIHPRTRYLDAYFFLSALVNDTQLSHVQDITKIKKMYTEKYQRRAGLPTDIREVLRVKLNKTTKMVGDPLNQIADAILQLIGYEN